MSLEAFSIAQVEDVLSNVIDGEDENIIRAPLLLCISRKRGEDVPLPGDCPLALGLCPVTHLIKLD